MATFWKAPTINFFQTTLNGAINDSTQTIALNSITNLQAPGYIVVDRQDLSGANTPNAREVITFTGIAGSSLTGCVRAADNSTARSHADGALVESNSTVGLWNDLSSIVSGVLTADGVVKALISPVSLARAEFIQVAVSSIASIARIETSTLVASQIQGVKGHFLWTTQGALATSLATSTNNSQIPFLRATKNLTLNSVYVGLNSAPSLGPWQGDVYYKSTPTGVTGTSIFSVRPLVGIANNDNLSGATPGTLTLTSLASGTLLYPEIRQPNGSGDWIMQVIATERL